MANNFNTKDFLRGEYFSPIKVGKHQITFGKIKTVIEEKDGKDVSYLLVPMTFQNNRTLDQRFYGLSAKIFCDQTRQQLQDETDYKKLSEYLKTLEGKTVDCWVSKRTYLASDDTIKTTLQYDFIEPKSTEETSETASTNPFN